MILREVSLTHEWLGEGRYPFAYGPKAYLKTLTRNTPSIPDFVPLLNGEDFPGFLIYQHQPTGRIYLAIFRYHPLHAFPTHLMRYREPFFTELAAAHLLRNSSISHMNDLLLHPEETIEITYEQQDRITR